MQLYKFQNGQLFKLVDARLTRKNGETVPFDKEKVFKMWIPVEAED